MTCTSMIMCTTILPWSMPGALDQTLIRVGMYTTSQMNYVQTIVGGSYVYNLYQPGIKSTLCNFVFSSSTQSMYVEDIKPPHAHKMRFKETWTSSQLPNTHVTSTT